MNPAITNKQYDDLMAILAGPAVSTPATRPTVRKSRHFYRCEDCLTVAATETKLACKRDKWGYATQDVDAVCDACGGAIEYMGETKYTVGGHEYALQHQTGWKPACDGKCTGACGPDCECECGGENHGTGKVVEVYEQCGVPKLRMPENARAKGEEFRAALAACRAAWDRKYRAVTEAKRRGEWINCFDFYLNGQRILSRITKARLMRVHSLRIKKLAALTAEMA